MSDEVIIPYKNLKERGKVEKVLLALDGVKVKRCKDNVLIWRNACTLPSGILFAFRATFPSQVHILEPCNKHLEYYMQSKDYKLVDTRSIL